MKRIIILIITAISLTACVQKAVYSNYVSVPLQGWDADSVLTYTWTIEDTAADYRMLIDVRHTERYPYQNLWFFINKPYASTPLLPYTQDTIEFYLADERGQWLGRKHNSYYEMPVLYEEAYRFDSAGTYTLTIQHGMREQQLRGISDVGLLIQKEHGKE